MTSWSAAEVGSAPTAIPIGKKTRNVIRSRRSEATMRLDLGALVAAALERERRARDHQHRERPEHERRADDRADRDLDRLLAAATAEERDHRDDRLGERGADGREQRADRALAEVEPVPEPLDGVGEADRAAHDEHERSEELEGDHATSPAQPGRCLGQRPRGRPPGGSPGEQAAAEEGALERSVAVHPAAAEAGHLARRVEARQRLARRLQDAPVEVGLQPAERLAGEDVELDRDQRPGVGVEDAVRRGDPRRCGRRGSAGRRGWR